MSIDEIFELLIIDISVTQSIWEQHPEVCASDISGGSDRGAKSIIIGHVEGKNHR